MRLDSHPSLTETAHSRSFTHGCSHLCLPPPPPVFSCIYALLTVVLTLTLLEAITVCVTCPCSGVLIHECCSHLPCIPYGVTLTWNCVLVYHLCLTTLRYICLVASESSLSSGVSMWSSGFSAVVLPAVRLCVCGGLEQKPAVSLFYGLCAFPQIDGSDCASTLVFWISL